MKKLLTGIFALTMIISAAQAQDRKDTKHHHRRHYGMLSKKLNFSEDQKKQLKDINADFKQQMSELKKNDNITVKEFRSRMEEIRSLHHQKLTGVLTTDQKNQLEKMKEDRSTK